MQRALLIGSQTFGLAGVHHDLDRIGVILGRFGFEVRVRKEGEATREGILAGIRQLIAETQAGDAVVLYYSGHGGLVANPRHRPVVRDGRSTEGATEPRNFQFIVPTDLTRERFAGVLSAELAALIAELTTRTVNVTTIFDCCHSAKMVRGEFRPRGLPPRPGTRDVEELLEWLRGQGYAMDRVGPHTNPHVVNVFGCQVSESAYEQVDHPDGPGGVLTRALVDSLAEALAAGEPRPNWRAIEAQLTARVQRMIRAQTPVMTGPLGRPLFRVEAVEQTDVFSYAFVDGEHTLRAGSIHGIKVGDRFLIMPLEAGRGERESALAEAEATAVGGDRTYLKVQELPGRPAVPVGARAFRYEPKFQRRAVQVLTGREWLVPALERSPRLAVAEGDAAAVIATIAGSEGRLEVRDEGGRVLRVFSAGEQDPGAREVIGLLEQLARVAELLELGSGIGQARLATPPRIEWGVIRDEGLKVLPLTGAELMAGDRIFVKVTGGSAACHVSILGVGVSRRIKVLTDMDPGGVELGSGERFVLGSDDLVGQMPGVPLVWPTGVPRAVAQPMALVVVAGDRPVDLRPLESDVLASRDLLREDGTVHRDFGETPRQGRLLRFAVTQVRFMVRGEAHQSPKA